ncbi:hypothetical protein TIFTF001_002496 [Ficus carica]|uniref:Pentatricopeptide repeat-containing protein-mitochondrial domain-containing protein n=1 Tax=Ficus carica TaxID=3494 RepID=A0AA87Z423_FICCA|nr:hypothetical protein TIFTF001_002496 [Ficus carica]
MSSSIRHVRRLSTTAKSSISISRAKSLLQGEHDPDKALKIYSSVSDHYSSPAVSRYAQELTVRRLAKSRRFDDIESFIESHKNDPQVKQEPYLSSLILSYCSAGMFDHALRTFKQMDQLGTSRSAISFNALLSGFNKSKLFDKIPQLFDEIPKKYGLSPDVISYGFLVRAYCEKGETGKAMEILTGMEKNGHEVTAAAFTMILDALYKKGEAEEAEKLWDRMGKKGCKVDVAAYNVRIRHCQGGKPEKVKALIEEMSNAGLKPDTISYNYLMTSYCKSGTMDEAKKVYKELKKYGCNPNAVTFRTLVYHLCRTGDFETGYNVFKKSVVKHRIPDFNTTEKLVEGLVVKNKIEEAKEMLGIIKKKFPANLFNSWKKVEERLGLASAPDVQSAADGDEEASA